MAHSTMFYSIYINALALRHHFFDNKKRNSELEMDNNIISYSNYDRINILLYYDDRSEAFGDSIDYRYNLIKPFKNNVLNNIVFSNGHIVDMLTSMMLS